MLLALALMKQKSADQTRTDNKTSSTCKLSPSNLEKIKLNMVGCINSRWGRSCVATGSSGQPKARKEELRVLTKDAQTWLPTFPAPLPGTGSPKAACKSAGCGCCWGELAGQGKDTVCRRDPKGRRFGDHMLPDALGITHLLKGT